MSMADRDGKIWKDGQMVDWRDATLHMLTHSLHYGMAVFEGVRAYNTANGTAIFRLKEHTQRLYNSAKIFQMKVPFDMDTIMNAQLEVVRANKLESCYLRPLVWIGSEKMGVSARGNTIHVAIAAWPWGAYLGEEGLAKGIRVKTSSFTRHHVNVSMVRAKASGYYINSILANQEVTADGYDEALLLDTEGYVSEGAGENVFIVKSGKIYTPDLASCLDGITRDSVVSIARDFADFFVEQEFGTVMLCSIGQVVCCQHWVVHESAQRVEQSRQLVVWIVCKRRVFNGLRWIELARFKCWPTLLHFFW